MPSLLNETLPLPDQLCATEQRRLRALSGVGHGSSKRALLHDLGCISVFTDKAWNLQAFCKEKMFEYTYSLCVDVREPQWRLSSLYLFG